MRTIQKIITKVNGKYGAPMGRPGINTGHLRHPSKSRKRIYDCKVPMCSCCGAYDKGGAYWGSNRMGDIGELRVSYTKDLTYVRFYRREP